MSDTIIPVGQGPARLADSEDLARDELGFTHPYLHRRVDPQQPEDKRELLPREYSFGIYGLESYRTTKINGHDEESTTTEVP